MIKQVPGEKRKQSNFSTFQSLVNSSYSKTALLLRLTHSLSVVNINIVHLSTESFVVRLYNQVANVLHLYMY